LPFTDTITENGTYGPVEGHYSSVEVVVNVPGDVYSVSKTYLSNYVNSNTGYTNIADYTKKSGTGNVSLSVGYVLVNIYYTSAYPSGYRWVAIAY